MGSFRFSTDVTLPRLRQRVWLDGNLRSDVYCSSTSYSHGTSGSTATLEIPSKDWDGGKNRLRGKRVRVDVAFVGGSWQTVFLGYLWTVSGQVAANVLSATAVTFIGLADKVYVGQGDDPEDMSVEYPAAAVWRGVMQPTGWTVASVLRDIFSASTKTWRGGGGKLPTGWRNRLKLGSLAVLGSTYNEVPLGDLVFRQTTLRDALEQLVGLVGTVSFKERFEGNDTYLDFFELGDPGAPLKRVIVARSGEDASGSNVLDIDHEESADQVTTRIIALGDRRKFTVSCTTEHSTAPLERSWDPLLEATVLANPEAAKRGVESGDALDETRQEFSEDLAHVFRRYLLPDCLRRLIIEKDLAVELSDGSRLAMQVWKIPRVVTYNAVTDEHESTLGTVPVLLEGTQFDLENGLFVLKAPAINLVSSVESGGDVVDTYEEAVVGITLTAAAARLVHDTGVRLNGMSFDGIDNDGLVDVFVNESFRFSQITNEGFPFVDGDGIGHVYDEAWLYIEGTGWTLEDAALVTQDDEAVLAEFAKAALREKNSVRANYSVTTPFWTPAYALGDRIRVVGQDDAQEGTHQVMSVGYNLTNDHGTTISTDSSVPLTANQILEEGGE
jgi:hypothetical protein